MTYGTSYYALKDRAQLKAGETLLVLGAAGGVGAAAVELGKAMGARVVAAASTNDKVEFALGAGGRQRPDLSDRARWTRRRRRNCPASSSWRLGPGWGRTWSMTRSAATIAEPALQGHGLERTLSGGRLPGGNPGPAAEPDPAEVGVGDRGLLGRGRGARSQGRPRRQHGRADADVLPRTARSSPRVSAAPSRWRRRGRRSRPWATVRPWARSW